MISVIITILLMLIIVLCATHIKLCTYTLGIILIIFTPYNLFIKTIGTSA